MAIPIVAIVGRPNVGKSTLFNRLIGERLAIVEDVPGTTRDRIYGEVEWDGREFTVVDTGGLELQPETAMAAQVSEQVRLAMEEADVIIFMVDAAAGVTQVDLEIAEMLRRSEKPVILAANKADNPKLRQEVFQFHELGLGEPLPVSASHGVGTGDLLDAVLAELPPAPPTVETAMTKVAIVGRPNVGKSMLFNALLGQERVIVSDVPGTTRDAIDTVLDRDGKQYLLIDTAGMRRRGHIAVGIEKYSVMRALRAIGRADIVLLVIDAAEGITAQDVHIAGYVHEAAKGVIVLVNKWDLAKQAGLSVAEVTRVVKEEMKFMAYAPVLTVSAKTGRNVDKILPLVDRVYESRVNRVPTSELNQMINKAVADHAPPTIRRRRLKILYVTQADINPPTFVFFVNDPRLLHFSYERYLENKLRETFGFEGTAIRLVFRRRGEE